MNKLELKSISYKNKDNLILDDISFKVEQGVNLSIVGNISGKSTLALILKNKLKKDGDYLINGVEVVKSNAYVVDRFVSVVTKDDDFDDESIIDILFDMYDDKDKVDEIVKYFKIDKYLKYKLEELTDEIKYYIFIILNITNNKSFLVIDDLLCYLTNKQIELIYKYAKKNKISIIDITSNLDNVLNSKYLIALYNGSIAMEGDMLSCLKEEKLLKRLGFKLPFMYDLSLQLNYYEVINDIYLDYKKLEEAIWK